MRNNPKKIIQKLKRLLIIINLLQQEGACYLISCNMLLYIFIIYFLLFKRPIMFFNSETNEISCQHFNHCSNSYYHNIFIKTIINSLYPTKFPIICLVWSSIIFAAESASTIKSPGITLSIISCII